MYGRRSSDRRDPSFGWRNLPLEILPGQGGQDHVVVNMEQSFIRKESQVIRSRGALPDRERLLVGNHRSGLEVRTGHAVADKGIA